MKLLLYCLLAILWPVGQTHAQKQATNIRPLTVGDTLPPDLILENVVNHPTSQIRLSDLKGKLVILDFWGKYCAPCIHTLHKLDSLQKIYNGQIQVITITDLKDKDDLYKTLHRFKKTEKLSLPVILGNEQLVDYFPYTLVSHLIWIAPSGIIKAVTGGEYVTTNNIKEALYSKSINWPIKKDNIDFDYRKPLLDYTQSPESRPRTLYYSSFTTHLEGISAPNGTYIDSARNVSVTLFYNKTIVDLIGLALDYTNRTQREQFTLKVSDTTRFINSNPNNKIEWVKNNTFSYYAQLPMSLSQKETESFLRADIMRWLNLNGIYAEKKTKQVNGKLQSHYVITERTAFAELKNLD